MTPEEYRQFCAETRTGKADKHCERRKYTHRKARQFYAPHTRNKRFNSEDLKKMLMMNFRYPEDLSQDFQTFKHDICERFAGKADPVENKEASLTILRNTWMYTKTPEGKHKAARIGFYDCERICREVYDHFQKLHQEKQNGL